MKNVYLDNIPLSDAIRKWRDKIKSENIRPLQSENVPAGNLLEESRRSDIRKVVFPFYHAAAMDGYAVKFSDTFGASERSAKKLLCGQRPSL